MKKAILLIIMCIVTSPIVIAQSFTTEADTVKGTIYSYLNLHNNITNLTSSPIKITWRIINSDFPASWKLDSLLGICDNIACRPNINNQLFSQTFTSGDYDANATGDFHLQMNKYNYSHVESGMHYITIELKEGSTTRNVTFFVTKYPTGVTSITRTMDNIFIYPNPAKNEVNVIFDRDMKVMYIGVYNLIGKVVAIYKVNGNNAKLNLENTPSGIYFIRLSDSEGHILATRKFIRE